MDFMSDDNKRLITYFEEEFDCMGLCGTNLFWWSKPISEGRPENPCLNKLWERLEVLCV